MKRPILTFLAATFILFLGQFSTAQAESMSSRDVMIKLVTDAEKSIDDAMANDQDRRLCTALGALEAYANSLAQVLLTDYNHLYPALDKSIEMF